jgi:hypothetical protein
MGRSRLRGCAHLLFGEARKITAAFCVQGHPIWFCLFCAVSGTALASRENTATAIIHISLSDFIVVSFQSDESALEAATAVLAGPVVLKSPKPRKER